MPIYIRLVLFIFAHFSFAACSYAIPDSVTGSVDVHVPFCRPCRKHQVIDVVFLLSSESAVRPELSQVVANTVPSSLLFPSPGASSFDILFRFAVVWYGVDPLFHLWLRKGQDFTVNTSATQRSLELPPLSSPQMFYDNETVLSSNSSLLKAIRVLLDGTQTISPLSYFIPPPEAQLVSVTHLVVADSFPSSSSSSLPHEIARGMESQDEEVQSTMKAISRYGTPSSLHLTFLLASTPAFGNSSLEDRYGDCSGFNREQTLQKLKKSECGGGGRREAPSAGRSLQHALLSAGFRVRFLDPNELATVQGCSRQLLHRNEFPSSVYSPLQDLHCCTLSSPEDQPSIDPIACENAKVCPSVVLPSCLRRNAVSFHAGDLDNIDSSSSSQCNAQDPISCGAMNDHDRRIRTGLGEGSFAERELTKTKLEPLLWEPNKPFTQELARRGKPAILRQAQPSTWTALHRWSEGYISRYLENSMFVDVKLAHRNISHHKFYDADKNTSLHALLDFGLAYNVTDMTASYFFQLFRNNTASEMAYYFTALPRELRSDVLPDTLMFLSDDDARMQMKYLWMSSADVNLHTHFDQDHNFFVQISGRKRFMLFPPSESDKLYPFPRTHPLWHKAQTDFHNPDLEAFPAYRSAHAFEAHLEPGDLLYIPPYWWHFVTALTPSISVSTWSKTERVEECMNYVYGHEHKFDMLSHPQGRLYALRLYLDMMVETMYGAGQTTSFFRRLLLTRYSSLEVFPSLKVCTPAPVPVARHVYGDTSLDVVLGQAKFTVLSPEIRDFVFMDYCEDLVANVLSVNMSASFFEQCFLGQSYAFRNHDEEGLYLWAYR